MSEGAPFRAVTEVAARGSTPRLQHPDWGACFEWLFQGVTHRGTGEPFDMRLVSSSDPTLAGARWERLQRDSGFPTVVHGRQVHGSRVVSHGPLPAGLTLVDACDGHTTEQAGTLLTVSAADCVPISIVDPERRAVALLHAGWRGAAAGVLEGGLAALASLHSSRPVDLHLHLGPAICGRCYEVGPEVHAALGMPSPESATPVDLRAVLARRAVEAGVSVERVTASTLCTRCGDAGLFSHRAGDEERQVALLGIRGGSE